MMLGVGVPQEWYYTPHHEELQSQTAPASSPPIQRAKPNPQLEESLFQRAHNLYTEKKTQDALRVALKLHSLNDKKTVNLLLLGAIHYDLGNFREAVEYNNLAISVDPNFAEAYGNLGNCLKELGDINGALSNYHYALKLKPNFSDAYNNLACTYVHLNKTEEALKCYEKCMSACPDHSATYINMANVLRSTKRHEEALGVYEKLLKRQPDNQSAWMGMAMIHLDMGNEVEADNCFEEAAKCSSRESETFFWIAQHFKDNGNRRSSVKYYLKAIEKKPKYALAYGNLASVYYDEGNFQESEYYYRKAIEAQPNFPDAFNNLGNTLKELGKLDEAIECYHRALELKPDHFHSYNNLGNSLKDKGLHNEAMVCYKSALDINPSFPAAHSNLASLYKEMGLVDYAIAHYNHAIQIDNTFADAYSNLANVLKEKGDIESAIVNYQMAIQLKPNFADAHANLANAYKDSNRVEQSIVHYKKALELKPDFPDAFANLVHSLNFVCEWKNREHMFQKLEGIVHRQLEAGHVPCVQPFHAMTYPFSSELFLTICQIYAKKSDYALQWNIGKGYNIPPSYPDESKSPTYGVVGNMFGADALETDGTAVPISTYISSLECGQTGRIRVGYMSSDFGNHPLSHLMQSVFGYHDRTKFEIFCYALSGDDQSQYRKKIEGEVEHFVDISGLNVVQSYQLIQQDRIQILINLNGYTKGARNEIFSLQPAPIQAMYMGFAGTSGATYMQYYITDEAATPLDHACYFSERLVHLPHSYFVNDHKQSFAHLVDGSTYFRRSDYGLPEDKFIFCNFNQLYKIDPVIFDVWMNILKRVPNSVLWLLRFPASGEENIRREASKRGIPQSRIIFTNVAAKEEHVGRGVLADLFLDTPLCNGHTTGTDILWSSTPMLTYPLHKLASRVASSLLMAVDCPELIAENYEDYEEKAVHIATDRAYYLSLREKIRDNRYTHPLFDTKRWVMNLESSLVMMWENYISGRNPVHIRVEDVFDSEECQSNISKTDMDVHMADAHAVQNEQVFGKFSYPSGNEMMVDQENVQNQHMQMNNQRVQMLPVQRSMFGNQFTHSGMQSQMSSEVVFAAPSMSFHVPVMHAPPEYDYNANYNYYFNLNGDYNRGNNDSSPAHLVFPTPAANTVVALPNGTIVPLSCIMDPMVHNFMYVPRPDSYEQGMDLESGYSTQTQLSSPQKPSPVQNPYASQQQQTQYMDVENSGFPSFQTPSDFGVGGYGLHASGYSATQGGMENDNSQSAGYGDSCAYNFGYRSNIDFRGKRTFQ